ncbi:MAG: glycosyltransferase family 1 protein [Eubacteriales bacterium]
MDPIRVLYINGGIMDRGGVSAYMMNYYRHIDRSKVQIDFVVHGFEKGVFDDEIQELGGLLYNVPVKSKNYFGNIRALRKIFRSGQYKIVHSHMDAMGAVVLKEARKCGIPIRIAHSHNTDHLTNNKIKYLLNEIARKRINEYSTHLFACSELAGKWLFGEKAFNAGDVRVIKNAIEVETYKYDKDISNRMKKELSLENNYIIGNIGRFDYQKNHIFLLDVFKHVIKLIPNAKLVLVGDGHLRKKIEAKIEELGLSNSVLLLGQCSNINEILCVFDVFVLPSLFEGLGIAAVEAQVNGLRCCLSDTLPKEVVVTDKIEFLSTNNINDWVNALVNIRSTDRTIYTKDFFDAGYDIIYAAKKLCDIYIDMVKGV